MDVISSRVWISRVASHVISCSPNSEVEMMAHLEITSLYFYSQSYYFLSLHASIDGFLFSSMIVIQRTGRLPLPISMSQ